MGMIVTLYLISANVYSSVEAPKDRGFSYIESWMIITQFPILLALCQYGIVLYWKKIAKKPRNQNEIDHENIFYIQINWRKKSNRRKEKSLTSIRRRRRCT